MDWLNTYHGLKAITEATWGYGGSVYRPPNTPVIFAIDIIAGLCKPISEEVALRINAEQPKNISALARDYAKLQDCIGGYAAVPYWWRKSIDGSIILQDNESVIFWNTFHDISLMLNNHAWIQDETLTEFMAGDLKEHGKERLREAADKLAVTAGDMAGRAAVIFGGAIGKGVGAGAAGIWDEMGGWKYVLVGGGGLYVASRTGVI